MTADDSLNKTVAKFKHNGQDYEIDWLTDQDGVGQREYDIFDVNSCHVASISVLVGATEEQLIEQAKAEIDAEEAMSA